MSLMVVVVVAFTRSVLQQQESATEALGRVAISHKLQSQPMPMLTEQVRIFLGFPCCTGAVFFFVFSSLSHAMTGTVGVPRHRGRRRLDGRHLPKGFA
jgi:hypothetical protein